MSKKFIDRMSQDEILEDLLFAIEVDPKDVHETKTHQFHDYLLVSITSDQELDDEVACLTDDFTVDDYDVSPMDWAPTDGGLSVRTRWRKRLHKRLGDEYAMNYLMNH